MFEFRIGGVRCRLSLLFPALLTALLLAQPEGLAVACLLAAVIHESGHLLAMLLLRVPPEDCLLGAFGARIRLNHCSIGYKQNLIISIMGPLTNLLCAVILWGCGCGVPAVVHLGLALINLLPADALDGGEILRGGLCLLGLGAVADSVLRITSALVLIPLAAVGFWLVLRGEGNATLLIISGYLVMLVFFSDKLQKNS